MSIIQTLNQYTGILVFLGALIVAGTYLFVSWKKGYSSATSDAVSTLESLNKARKEELVEERRMHTEEVERMRSVHQQQIDELTKRIESQEKQIEGLRKEMKEQNDKYQAILIEKDKQIANVTNILQNRNPESQTVTEQAAKFMKDNGEKIDKIYQAVVKE